MPAPFANRLRGVDLVGAPGADQVPSARRSVVDIEGIGESFAGRLGEMGIFTIGDLWGSDAASVAEFLDVPESIVSSWRAMGELIDVQGIGPQFAELLVRCGIKSIPELAAVDPDELLARILLTSAERMVRIQGAPIGYQHVARWIDEARRYDVAPNAS